MHKNATIFHGTNGHPNNCWYRWLGDQLESRGYDVSIPFYPTLNKEQIETFLPRILDECTFNEDTVLIGHSGGAALLLAILEHIDVTISQAILVAGYATPPNTSEEPVLQKTYDWNLIKSHVVDPYFLNSIQDPYGCDDKQGRFLFDRIGGTQIICNEGHFGDYNQLYPKIELVNKLIK